VALVAAMPLERRRICPFYYFDFFTFAETENQNVRLSTASELQLWHLVEAACWRPQHAHKSYV